jgi:hypothetical protein
MLFFIVNTLITQSSMSSNLLSSANPLEEMSREMVWHTKTTSCLGVVFLKAHVLRDSQWSGQYLLQNISDNCEAYNLQYNANNIRGEGESCAPHGDRS